MRLAPREIDLIAYLVGLSVGFFVLFGSGYADFSADAVRQGDFAKFWVGPRALLLGIDPYNSTSWHETAVALGARNVNWPDYGYFGWTLVLLLPLALIPLDLAFTIWTFGGLAAAAMAMRALLHRYLPGLPVAHTLIGLALVGSQPSRLTILLGQWGFFLVAALAAAVLLAREGRTVLGGAAAALLFAKPQLFVLLAPAGGVWAWLTRRRGLVIASVTFGAVLALVSILMMPGWPAAWLRDIPSQALFDRPRTTTLAAMFNDLLGPPGGPLAFAVILIGAFAASRFDPRGDAWLACWCTLSLVAAPYTWSYDHVLLLVPLVIAAGVAASRSRAAAIAVIVVGTLILLVLSTLLAVIAAVRDLESYSAVVPVLTFLLIVVAMWPTRGAMLQPAVVLGASE